MLIIIHRVNTIEELKKVPKEYGVEIDVRAFGDKLILNHDPYKGGEELEAYLKHYQHSFIIFNIKDSGIENDVIALASKYNIDEYFLLDVEYPFVFKTKSKKIAIRYSEYEPIEYVLKNKLNWVWVDVFNNLPLTVEDYQKMKEENYKLCLVSPEHLGRPEDIAKYKEFFKENNMKIDAVMTEMKHLNDWI